MILPFQYLYRQLLRQQIKGFDPLLLGLCLLIACLGVFAIYTASTPLSDRLYGSSMAMLRAHLLHLTLGLGLLWLGMHVPYGRWQELVPYALLLSFVLLILVLLPGLGRQVSGARRWLDLGVFVFQPTELLKFTLVAHVASYLDRKPEHVQLFFRGLAPNIAVMGVFLALVLLEPDFGTVVLITLVLLLMVFVGGAKPAHILFSVAGLGAIGVWLVASHAYRMRRMMAFLDPWQDRLDSGFQIIQSYLAFGQGGLMGAGIGASRQKMFFLPDAHTDFIFSILAEELGFVGVFAVMTLFTVFLWRAFRVSLRCEEDFGKYLAFGIATLLSLQVLLNLAVVMGMMPTKGLPLPFISKGGSSLLITFFMVGVLLNIGRQRQGSQGRSPGRAAPRAPGRPAEHRSPAARAF